MNKRGLTLLDVLLIVVVIALLSALLLPPLCGPGIRRAKLANCGNNLQQLYRLGAVYAQIHQGQWPTATGEDLWLSFTKTTPPLIDTDGSGLFHCDVVNHGLGSNMTNYRGPRIPWSQLKANDPIAADKEGNHGEGESINVLFKDGTVLEATPGDALWRKCREILGP